MCGRYASSRRRQELLEAFAVPQDETKQELSADYNVAPTKPIYGVVERHARDDRDEVERQLRVLRWGLVPSWAKDTKIGNRLINARAETVAEKPAFRRPFARRRCLLPADGYYEWYDPQGETTSSAGGSRRSRKQPFFIHRDDGGILAFAGLYELWRDPDRADDDSDAWLWSATIITTEASDEVGRIHDRMPMVVPRDNWAVWLDPHRTDVTELRGLLVPAMSGRLTAYPVSTAVNNVRNNGPELVEAMPAEPANPTLPTPE